MQKESRSGRIELLYNRLKSSLETPIILDGAMGSHLQKSGFISHPKLWFSYLNIEHPDAITQLHSAYINAGAEVITTNTFRTNPSSAGAENSPILVKAALECAKNAADKKALFIAGSNPPAEDSYQALRTISKSILESNHKRHIELLMENGADFILNETQSHYDEIELISGFCSLNKIPYLISIYFTQNLHILSGESIFEVIDLVHSFNPVAAGFNCIDKYLFRDFLEKFNPVQPWGFYLNYGLGNVTDENIIRFALPGSEEDIIIKAKEKGVNFIGGCCGSGPEHITKIKQVVSGIYCP